MARPLQKADPAESGNQLQKLAWAPEYIAVLSDWKFPERIAASHFRPDLPKGVKRIEFLKVKESKP